MFLSRPHGYVSYGQTMKKNRHAHGGFGGVPLHVRIDSARKKQLPPVYCMQLGIRPSVGVSCVFEGTRHQAEAATGLLHGRAHGPAQGSDMLWFDSTQNKRAHHPLLHETEAWTIPECETWPVLFDSRRHQANTHARLGKRNSQRPAQGSATGALVIRRDGICCAPMTQCPNSTRTRPHLSLLSLLQRATAAIAPQSPPDSSYLLPWTFRRIPRSSLQRILPPPPPARISKVVENAMRPNQEAHIDIFAIAWHPAYVFFVGPLVRQRRLCCGGHGTGCIERGRRHGKDARNGDAPREGM